MWAWTATQLNRTCLWTKYHCWDYGQHKINSTCIDQNRYKPNIMSKRLTVQHTPHIEKTLILPAVTDLPPANDRPKTECNRYHQSFHIIDTYFSLRHCLTHDSFISHFHRIRDVCYTGRSNNTLKIFCIITWAYMWRIVFRRKSLSSACF